MTINRRNFLKLVATALAGEAVGQTVPDGKLPPQWEKKFAALNLSELDKAIVKAVPLVQNPKGNLYESLYNCMTNPLWKDVDTEIKKEIAALMEAGEYVGGIGAYKEKGMGFISLQSLRFSTYYKNEIIAEPLVIKPKYVYGWTERPEKAQNYIILPKAVSERLKPGERPWVDALLFAVNDNIHTLLSVPCVVPTKEELMGGKVNAKIMCTVGGLFPKRMEENLREYSIKEKLEVWRQTIQKIDVILKNRGIPEEMWAMFHKVGYIYVLSDFEGTRGIGGGSRCTKPLFTSSELLDVVGVKVDTFNNATTPVSRRVRGLEDAILDKQRERRSEAAGNLHMALMDMAREETTLTMAQKRSLAAITAQASAIRSRMSKVAVAHQGAIMPQKNTLTYTRGE